MSVPQIFSQFTEGLSEINALTPGRALPADRGRKMKQTASTVYDLAAAGSERGDLWNWGMYDQEVSREIDDLIPGFDRFDTDGQSEQLYFLAVRDIPGGLEARRGQVVAEVGCGAGEGLNFLSRIVPAQSFTGVDISPGAVARAGASLSRGPGLRYLTGDAEDLPFEDGSVDLLINIESSHTYPNLGRFLEEVSRVLRPGGVLSHIDLFTDERYALMTELRPRAEELDWISDRDISSQVRAGIRRRLAPGSHFRRSFAGKRVNPLVRPLMEHSRAVMFGAVFVGYRDPAAIALVRRLGLLPRGGHMPVSSYRHQVAVKVDR